MNWQLRNFNYITTMRTGIKVNVVSVINITIVSILDRLLLITVGLYRSASAPSSRRTNAAVVRLSQQIIATCIWRPRWG